MKGNIYRLAVKLADLPVEAATQLRVLECIEMVWEKLMRNDCHYSMIEIEGQSRVKIARRGFERK